MRRALSLATWLFFAAIMYLILSETIWPWIKLPDLGNIGFVLIFVVFSVLHCAVTEGWKRTALFFAISALVSFVMEEIGVRSGLVFGPYHYGDLLGTKLGHVPFVIPLGWFMMIYPSLRVAQIILGASQAGPVKAGSLKAIVALALVSAFVMTAWDTVMDPGMASDGNWIWEQGGPYFGVPLHNYFGWLLNTFLIYVVTGIAWRGTKKTGSASAGFAFLPVVVYSFFAVRYVVAGQIAALQVVALFAMGVPALIALLKGPQTSQTIQ